MGLPSCVSALKMDLKPGHGKENKNSNKTNLNSCMLQSLRLDQRLLVDG